MKTLRFILWSGLALLLLTSLAQAQAPPGQQLPPGIYHMHVTAGDPACGGMLDISPPGTTQPSWWNGNDGSYGPVFYDPNLQAYELPCGDLLYCYPDGTWTRTTGPPEHRVRACGTYTQVG